MAAMTDVQRHAWRWSRSIDDRMSGPGFAPARTPYTYAPLIILAGARGVDAMLARLDLFVARRASIRWAAVVGAGCWACADPTSPARRLFRSAPILANLPVPAKPLARLPLRKALQFSTGCCAAKPSLRTGPGR